MNYNKALHDTLDIAIALATENNQLKKRIKELEAQHNNIQHWQEPHKIEYRIRCQL